MRPFRGQRIDNREWCYGFYCVLDGKHYIIAAPSGSVQKSGLASIWGFCEVHPETVGQSTDQQAYGEKDVFVGDIMGDENGECLGVVKFGNLPLNKGGDCVCTYPAFYIDTADSDYMFDCCSIGSWMKILGNNHENPELLKCK